MTTSDPSLDRILHAIADPTRRRILEALKERDACSINDSSLKKSASKKGSTGKGVGLCAGDVEERVRLSQPTISHHMAILTRAGLVEAVKHGQWRWYRRNEPALRKLLKTLRTNL
jgi:DNA-binding transcriptional ArsR family regulator